MTKNILLASLAVLSFNTAALETSLTDVDLTITDYNSDTLVLTIAGPDDYSQKLTFSGSYGRLSVTNINDQTDGLYNYEVIATKKTGEEFVDARNGRDSSTLKDTVTTELDSGHFRLLNGYIVTGSDESE